MKLVVPRPAPLKIQMNTTEDPTLQQERERNNEDRTTLACQTGEYYQYNIDIKYSVDNNYKT